MASYLNTSFLAILTLLYSTSYLSRCQTPQTIWTLVRYQPVIPSVILYYHSTLLLQIFSYLIGLYHYEFARLANSYSLLSLWSPMSNRTYGWPIAHFFFQKKRRGTGFSVIQTIHCVYQYTHGHAKLLTFISWAMAYPFRTTGSLSPTCVPARLISLTVKHVYAFTLHLALHSQLVSI